MRYLQDFKILRLQDVTSSFKNRSACRPVYLEDIDASQPNNIQNTVQTTHGNIY